MHELPAADQPVGAVRWLRRFRADLVLQEIYGLVWTVGADRCGFPHTVSCVPEGG